MVIQMFLQKVFLKTLGNPKPALFDWHGHVATKQPIKGNVETFNMLCVYTSLAGRVEEHRGQNQAFFLFSVIEK